MLALDANSVVLGRGDPKVPAAVDLDLSRYDPDNTISRRHANILREGRKYSLIDLNSTNGTRLNGEPIPAGKKVPLFSGNVIEFGQGLSVIFMTAEARTKEREKRQTEKLLPKRPRSSRR